MLLPWHVIHTSECSYLRGMVKNLPLLRRAGNSGRPWVHAIMCDNTYSNICMIIHVDCCFNLVKSVNRLLASHDRTPHH